MIITTNPAWVMYDADNAQPIGLKCGKWMHFFMTRAAAVAICETAITTSVVNSCKHSNGETGMICFYIDGTDLAAHQRVIRFMLDNQLIRKTEAGKLFDIAFKFDLQTVSGEYGQKVKAVMRLPDFIDLRTGDFFTDEEIKRNVKARSQQRR